MNNATNVPRQICFNGDQANLYGTGTRLLCYILPVVLIGSSYCCQNICYLQVTAKRISYQHVLIVSLFSIYKRCYMCHGLQLNLLGQFGRIHPLRISTKLCDQKSREMRDNTKYRFYMMVTLCELLPAPIASTRLHILCRYQSMS